MDNKNENKIKTPKNVWFLGLTSFFNDIGGEILNPILPLFLLSLGAPGTIIGIISGLREGIGRILQVFAGYLADRVGKRKPFIVFGYFFSGFSKLFLAFSSTWVFALIFSTSERIGKGVREAPRDAIISESGLSRSKAFAIHKSLDTAGGILGSVLVFILYDTLNLSFKTLILIASAIIFVSLIPVSFVKDIQKEKQNTKLFYTLKKIPKSVWLFIFVSCFYSIANFGYVFLILKAQANLPIQWAIIGPLILYILFNIFYAGFSVPFGILSDKVGKSKIILLGYILFLGLSIFLAIFKNFIIIIISFIIYGLIYAILQSQQKAFVADLCDKEYNATGIGAWNTFFGLSAIPGGLISGYLWDINPSYTFIFGAILSLICILLFIFGRKLKWF